MSDGTERTAGSRQPAVTMRPLRAACCLLLAVAAGTSAPRAQQPNGGQASQPASAQAPAKPAQPPPNITANIRILSTG